jgi:hypothetical protein
MNGWVKFFTDGTTEQGFDDLVKTKQASWSKGRLEDITQVLIVHDETHITLRGVGKFWQTDTLEARLLVDEGIIVQRTIYKKIQETDLFLTIHNSLPQLLDIKIDNKESPNCIRIFPRWIGKWVIAEIDVATGMTSWRIGDL